MKKPTEKPVDINSLPLESRQKVCRIRGKIKRGSYVVAGKDVDDKTVKGLLDDIKE